MAGNTAPANGTPRRARRVTTPKQLGALRIMKLREHVSKTRERFRGWHIDSELADLETYVGLIEKLVLERPDDFNPSRGSRQGPQVEAGQRWKLKSDSIKKYWGSMEEPIAEFKIQTIIDSKQIQVRFTDGTKCIVNRADIGDRIED
jgi:hypothetical protein